MRQYDQISVEELFYLIIDIFVKQNVYSIFNLY